jgi:SAM-dependent methyltransferase
MRIEAVEGHRIWAPTYDDGRNPLLALETRLLADRLEPLRGRTFLDVAAGTGRWMLHARTRGARVIGVDLCREMLLTAARKPHLAGRLVLGDASCLPIADGAADVALCSFALGYFPSLPAAFAEMARAACTVVISDLHPKAVEHSWARSFRANGRLYELDHHAYSEAELDAAARCAGLAPLWRMEASLGEPERPIFRAAGREWLFPAASLIPAVLMTAWHPI